MDISIFGYKLNLEVLILIGVIYLILIGHTVCGCCKFNLMESFTSNIPGNGQILTDISHNLHDPSGNSQSVPKPGASTIGNNSKGTVSHKEGFSGANTNYGQSSPYDLNTYTAINPSSWNASDMTVIPGKTLSPGVQQILNREPQPVPLNEGELLLFANTPFKPECCPNTYSNGSGCACMTVDQYNYLINRGGNNVPYSEY